MSSACRESGTTWSLSIFIFSPGMIQRALSQSISSHSALLYLTRAHGGEREEAKPIAHQIAETRVIQWRGDVLEKLRHSLDRLDNRRSRLRKIFHKKIAENAKTGVNKFFLG